MAYPRNQGLPPSPTRISHAAFQAHAASRRVNSARWRGRYFYFEISMALFVKSLRVFFIFPHFITEFPRLVKIGLTVSA